MSKKSSNTTSTISLSATITATAGGSGSGDGGGSNKKSKSDGSNSNEQMIGPKKPRTIQVKIGNQAAKEMTPDQAADYLRLLATAGAAAAATAGGGGGSSSGRNSSGNMMMPQQVKMTFQNGTTETVPLTTGGGSSGAMGSSSNSGSGSSSNLFRKSNKKSGNNSCDVGVGAAGSSNNNVNNMPCTEKEMKALMSMFVEIMGLQMNTDKLNKQQYMGGKKRKKKSSSKKPAADSNDDNVAACSSDSKSKVDGGGIATAHRSMKESKNKQLFHFPTDLPPPPGGWPQDLLWPNGCGKEKNDDDDEYDSSDEYDDDDSSLEELSSLPDLEDIPPDVRQKAATAAATRSTAAFVDARNGTSTTSSSNNNAFFSPARKTGVVAGIAVPEWDALERVAMEEALEQEERARKSSKAAASSNSTAASLSTSFLRSTVMEALTTSSSVSSSSMSSSAAVAAAAAAAACATSGGGVTSSTAAAAASRVAIAAANSQAAAAREAAQATAALKRRAKAAQVWRTKVIAACQSCDTQTLDKLLKEDSDLRKQLEKQEKESSANNTSANNSSNNSTSNTNPSSPTCNDVDPSASSPTFDILLPYCLPNTKNHRASLIKTRETRQRLARHLLSICPSRLTKQPLRNNGRTVLHMACMYGDYPLVKQILQANNNSNNSSINKTLSSPNTHDNGLDFPCQDSGWTPLHYAALSGSMQTMELLLSKGADLLAVTDDIHTWWSSTSKGLTPKQLVDVVASGKVEKQVETHGMALSEITKEFLNTNSDSGGIGSGDDATTTTAAATTTETRKYLAWLQRISQRLATLERVKKNNSSSQHYYTEPSKKELCDWSQEKVPELTVAAAAAAAASATSASNSNTNSTAASVVVAVDETSRSKTAAQVKAAPKVTAPSTESLSNKNQDDSSESESGTESHPMFAPTSTASNNNQNESKKKMKKKKKKSGNADNNNNSVTEISAPPSTNSALFTPAVEDPLVTALKGMGFAEKQILTGIQACGGASSATPDMIVAWIFEQESGGGGALDGNAGTFSSGNNTTGSPMEFTQQKKRSNETKTPSASTKPSNSASSSVSSSQHRQEKPAASTRKTNNVKQRENDNKLAVEQLAAVKREEQRRRNREWNKKQEAQRVEIVSRPSVSNNSAPSTTNIVRAPSPALMTGLPPVIASTSNTAAAPVPSLATPTYTILKPPPPGLASIPPPRTPSMSTMPAAEITTDASTIASSVGDFLNDDATISTIGSRTTNTQHSILQTFSNSGGNGAVVGPSFHHHQQQYHYQQALHSQSQQQHLPVAPPGFGPSVAAVPESLPVVDDTWQQASLGLGQRLYAPPVGSSIGGGAAVHAPPPGIPNSRPFVDQRAHASSMTAASMGSLQSRMSAAHEAFAGGFSGRAPNMVLPQQHLSSSSVRSASVGSSGYGPSSLFGLQQQHTTPVLHHHQSMPGISDPSFAANSSSHTLGSHHNVGMDSSSLIESMATGNAPIGGASLWGSHDSVVGSTSGSSLLGGPPAPSSGGGGSSLLGNLIQTNQARQQQQQQQQVDSIFSFDNQPPSSLNGWGDNRNLNPSINSFGDSSNSNNNRGFGGHPVGGDHGTSNQRDHHGNIW